jgi:hypothetical protein
MVHDVEVLKAFWWEALLTIAYLQNKIVVKQWIICFHMNCE